MSDEQIDQLYEGLTFSISILNGWLNSAALWQLIGATLGLLILATLMAMLITKAYSAMGFRAR